jgi:hypothetical protein
MLSTGKLAISCRQEKILHFPPAISYRQEMGTLASKLEFANLVLTGGSAACSAERLRLSVAGYYSPTSSAPPKA